MRSLHDIPWQRIRVYKASNVVPARPELRLAKKDLPAVMTAALLTLLQARLGMLHLREVGSLGFGWKG